MLLISPDFSYGQLGAIRPILFPTRALPTLAPSHNYQGELEHCSGESVLGLPRTTLASQQRTPEPPDTHRTTQECGARLRSTSIPTKNATCMYKGLRVFAVDSSLGSHVQAPPLNRLLLLVQQIHQNRCVPFGENAQQRDRTESA